MSGVLDQLAAVREALEIELASLRFREEESGGGLSLPTRIKRHEHALAALSELEAAERDTIRLTVEEGRLVSGTVRAHSQNAHAELDHDGSWLGCQVPCCEHDKDVLRLLSSRLAESGNR